MTLPIWRCLSLPAMVSRPRGGDDLAAEEQKQSKPFFKLHGAARRLALPLRGDKKGRVDQGHDPGYAEEVEKVCKSLLKAKMLEYLRRVEETGEELIVTDNNGPVVRIVPIRPRRSGCECLRDVRGGVMYHDDVLAPTTEERNEPASLLDTHALLGGRSITFACLPGAAVAVPAWREPEASRADPMGRWRAWRSAAGRDAGLSPWKSWGRDSCGKDHGRRATTRNLIDLLRSLLRCSWPRDRRSGGSRDRGDGSAAERRDGDRRR